MHKPSPEQVKSYLLDDSKEYLQFKSALNIFGDKWSALIIFCVYEKPQRFTDIKEFAHGISPRTLTQRLQMLEESGMITRKEYKEFPPRTEYTVTTKARELKTAMMELKKWSKKYCKASAKD